MYGLFLPGGRGARPYGEGPGLCGGVILRSCLSLLERCPGAHTGAERVCEKVSPLSVSSAVGSPSGGAKGRGCGKTPLYTGMPVE